MTENPEYEYDREPDRLSQFDPVSDLVSPPEPSDDSYTFQPRELPLFPLDIVLFPSMLMPLHIFEERYKSMVNRCIREGLPFGITLAATLDADAGDHSTAKIGCAARIAHVERLPDGRMNIEIIGEGRFRILDTHEQLSYRVAVTEPLEDRQEDADQVFPLADEVQKLLRDFLTRSLALSGQSVPEFELPDDPQQLSFTAAWVLPVEMSEKQVLLAHDSTVDRLSAEREALLREVTRLRRTAESQQMLWRQVSLESYSDYVCPN